MKFENINSKLGGPFEREKPRCALYGSQLTREVGLVGAWKALLYHYKTQNVKTEIFSTQNSITEKTKTDTSRNWESSKLRNPKIKKILNREAKR